MVKIQTTSAGSYPRVGDASGQQALRRATEKLQRKELSEAEFHKVEDQTVREAIGEQIEAGIDLVTDGQIRWSDPISHFCRKLKNTEINGLLRLYDTNFYFRQPVFTALPQRTEPALLEEFRFAKSASPKPVKAVLTGPYTLTRLSVSKGPSTQELLRALTEVVSAEVTDLAREGASFIQLDEPEILRHPEDFSLLAASFKTLREKTPKTTQLGVHFSFGNVAPHLAKVLDLPVDVVGVDFTYSPNLLNSLTRSPRKLQLGIVDARNTRLENAQSLAQQVRPLLTGYQYDTLYLSPSAGLEFLPRNRAFEKLQILTQVKKLLAG